MIKIKIRKAHTHARTLELCLELCQFYHIPKFYSEENWGFEFSEQEMKMFASKWKIYCVKNSGSGALCAKYVFSFVCVCVFFFSFFSFHFLVVRIDYFHHQQQSNTFGDSPDQTVLREMTSMLCIL